jgi:hypothetical protein
MSSFVYFGCFKEHTDVIQERHFFEELADVDGDLVPVVIEREVPAMITRYDINLSGIKLIIFIVGCSVSALIIVQMYKYVSKTERIYSPNLLDDEFNKEV